MDRGEQEAGEEEGGQGKTGRGAPVQGSDEKCGGGEEDRHCVTFFYQSSKHVFFGSKKHSGMFLQIVKFTIWLECVKKASRYSTPKL